MKNYKVVRLEIQNELCQWVEVYKNNEWLGRVLIGKNQSDEQIVSEYYNGLEISKMF